MTSTRKLNISIYGLGLINILIHLAFYDNLEFHRDELLYFSMGLHPAAGYATVPPLTGWIAGLMQLFFGYSLFSVKLFPAVMSGAFVILCTLIARESGGKGYSQILTAVAVIIMPVTLRAFHLFQPVHLDLFFWTLIFYLILKYINTGKDTYIILTGGVFGLAMLNKYLIALLIPALFIPLLFTYHREIFIRRAFWSGLFTGLLIFLPNLLWQINKGFPVIRHMKELNESQLVYVEWSHFLTDQVLMTFSSFILVLAGLAFLIMEKNYRFLFFSVLIVFITLMLLHGKSYYTMGLFPFLIAAGGVFAERHIKSIAIRIFLIIIMISAAIPVFPIGIPVFKQDRLIAYFKMLDEKYGIDAGRRFEDGTIHSLPQDYADQLGWEELAKITSEAFEKVPEKTRAAIFCDNYGQAGAIAIIGKKYKLPEPLSFNESFRYWIPNEFNPDIEYLFYINDEPGEDVRKLFSDIQLAGKISNIHAREYGTGVFICSKPSQSFNEFWKSRIESD